MKTDTKYSLRSVGLVCLALAFFLLPGGAKVFGAHIEVWRTVLEHSASTDVSRFLGKMDNGDFILVGRTGSAASQDILMFRMRADGTIAWTKTLNYDRSDDAVDLVTDPVTGDTYLCGSTSVLTPLTPAPQYRTNWYVMKVSGTDGSNMWSAPYVYDGGSNESEAASCITFLQEGGVRKIIVAGNRYAVPMGGRIVKLNATTGALEASYNGTASYSAVVTDSDGNVYASGKTNEASLSYARVDKFNSALAEQWTRASGTTGTFNSWGYMALDPVSKDVIVNGLITNASGNNDIGLARYNPAGVRSWINLYDGAATSPATNNDSGTGVIVSGDSAYISGNYRQTATGADWFLARVALAGGGTTWQKTFSGGTGNSGEQVGNFIVKGTTLYAAGHMTPAAGRIPVVLELDIATGNTLVRTDFTARLLFQSFPGNKSMIVTSDNNIIFAGDDGETNGAGVVTRYGPSGPVAAAPTLAATPTQTGLGQNGVTLGGNVTNDGGAAISARGVVYSVTSTNNNPTIGGTGVLTSTAAGTTGTFTATVGGLAASTTYSFKAYATNSVDTSYSSVGTFTTSAASATITFNSTAGISGSQVTDGQGGSTDASGISLQFSAKAADGTTDLPMTYQPNIYAGVSGIAGGYATNSIQSVYSIKSSSQATNFTMSSIFIVDYGGTAGDLLRIEAFDNGVSAGFITYQVSGSPWSATVNLASLGGTKFVNIDEVRITGNGGVDMYIAVNNVTISGINTSVSTATVSSLNRANATPTNLNTVNWTLTFGSAVTGVTASNFTLGGTSTGAAVGTPTTANAGLSWTVPVTTGTDGTLLLRLDNDTGLSSDVTTTLPFVGETYTVDKTAPNTTIASNPLLLTTSTNASFGYTGTDAGSGLASFQVKLDAAVFTAGTSPTSYTGLADGSHTFQVRAVDAAGNVDASPASYTWVVDTTPPQVLSVTRQSPTGQATSATSVTFRVTYSEAVTLNAPASARYAVAPVGGSTITGTVTGVTGTGATRDVTVSITGGTGEFRLRVVD